MISGDAGGETVRREALSAQGKQYGEEQERALGLWVVMNRAMASLHRRIEADIRARGFSQTEWGVLEYLYHKGAQPLAKVGEKILITSGSVTYVIDKLEAKGLIRRVPCESDRRVTWAVLTEAGEALMQVEFPQHAEAVKEALSPLSPAEQEEMERLLKKVGLASSLKAE